MDGGFKLEAQKMQNRAVASGCKHSMSNPPERSYSIIDRSIRSLPLAVLHRREVS